MPGVCLLENSFPQKMSVKFILVVWSYHIAILKQLLSNSMAVFFSLFIYIKAQDLQSSTVVTIKLWISLCQLGSKQHNVYYVTSSNDFKLCDFNVFYLDSYGDGSVIYNILSHDISSCFWHIKTYAHTFY